MKLSASTLKSLILKGPSLLCGATGVSIGGLRCAEYINPTIFDYLNRDGVWIDSSVLNSSNSIPERDKIDVFLNKNIGCFYRYFGKYVDSNSIDVPNSKQPTASDIPNQDISKISQIKTGCAIIQKNLNNKEDDKNFRIEIMFMNDTVAELFYILMSNQTLNIYRYDLTKKDNSWSISSSSKWSRNNQEKLVFKYKLDPNTTQSVTEGTNNYISDLMLQSSNDSKNIIVTKTTSSDNKEYQEIELKGQWKKRDEYCLNIKDKTVSSSNEISKIKEWCSSQEWSFKEK